MEGFSVALQGALERVVPRGRVRYYARGARRHVCAHAMWLVVGARFVRACLDLCGSELARDGGVSVNDGVGCDGLIASKLAPTGISGDHKVCVWQKSSVGASLLAMAECQSTMVLDVMASSRASSLPQGICGVHGFCVRQKSNCGSELARDGGISGNQNLRSENSPPTDSTARPAAPARYKPSMSIANSPRLAGSGC